MAFMSTVRGLSASSSESINTFITLADPTTVGMAAALSAFYNEYADHCNGTVSFSLDPEIREFDEATGQTIGLTAYPGGSLWIQNGTSSPTSMPDQTAILVRWRTGQWINGRQVTGRTYLPYPSQSTGGGQPSASVVNDIQTQAGVLIAAVGLRIWSRTNGTTRLVTSSSVWGEYAVQRRRRD